MKTFRQFMAIMAPVMALCVIPCLLSAEIPETGARTECDMSVRVQQGGGAVDISACQNACRMRYGPAPSTGFSGADDQGSQTEKSSGATVEQSNPGLYSQCMEDCERNYWKQFDEDTSGSKRRR
jgi:hypothetical protein